MPRKKSFRIGRSRTGLGLFATEPIKKKDFIVEYKGRRLDNEEADKLEARGSRYLYEINSRWTIDGSGRKNLGRYANHSCRPNADSHQLKGKVFLRAIKSIKPGEEITWNYGRDYFRERHHAKRLQMREMPGKAQQAAPRTGAGSEAARKARRQSLNPQQPRPDWTGYVALRRGSTQHSSPPCHSGLQARDQPCGVAAADSLNIGRRQAELVEAFELIEGEIRIVGSIGDLRHWHKFHERRHCRH